MNNKTKNWREEFDEKFPIYHSGEPKCPIYLGGQCDCGATEEIKARKHFISKQIKKAKQEVWHKALDRVGKIRSREDMLVQEHVGFKKLRNKYPRPKSKT